MGIAARCLSDRCCCVEVEHDDIRAAFAQSPNGVFAVLRDDDVIALRGQEIPGKLSQAGVIVDHQHDALDRNMFGGRPYKLGRVRDLRPSLGEEDAGDLGAELVDFADLELVQRDAVNGSNRLLGNSQSHVCPPR